MIILSSEKHIAQKQYECDACVWVYNCELWDCQNLTLSELKEIVKARRNKWCIMPGQEYIRQISVEDGKLYVWRGLPAIDAICHKYEVYEYV